MPTGMGTGQGPGTGPGQDICDSCGLVEHDLATVRRVYLDADEAGELRVADTVDEVERWCGSCRAHYPHVEEDPGTAGR